MSYFACEDCDFTTLYEAGAAAHSKEKGHAVIEKPRPANLIPLNPVRAEAPGFIVGGANGPAGLRKEEEQR